MQIKTKIVSWHTAVSKPVKQEVNSTMILSPLVLPASPNPHTFTNLNPFPLTETLTKCQDDGTT
jgi:hypothetical protein